MSILKRVGLLIVPLALLLLTLAACNEEEKPILKVGGIPDQDTSRLARRYEGFAQYLSDKLDVEVQYVPSTDYSAVVTAFGQGDIDLAFFGGLTGVQARLQNPGAEAIVQRENDAKFHSKFIVRADLPINSMEDLKVQSSNLTITFGSESSTSGHLMPRHYLTEADINPDTDFKGVPNYSGSHDITWQLVESGTADVGALNEDVWNLAVSESAVDTSKVREFWTTPDYFDYHWMVRPDVEDKYGDGFTEDIKEALLELNPEDNADIMDLFSAQKFIETNNENYATIEQVGRDLGLIQ